jgi:hypothetical protein
MREQPSEIPHSSRRPDGDPDGQQDDRREERYGTVTIARHRKDDGRALILYSRAPGEHA